MKRISIVILSLALIGGCYPKERYIKTVEKVLPTTVTIHVFVSRIRPGTDDELQTGEIIGSGVFVTRYGHILSCAHLFNHGLHIDGITVENYNGDIYAGEVLYLDSKKDLSLVKIEESGNQFAQCVRPGGLKVGQEVIAVGSPEGLTSTVTTGILSALDRDAVGYDMIQMSAPINPGNSGGPLFDLDGNLVGINVSVVTVTPIPIWSGLGFAVSDNQINIFLHTFKGLSEAIK